METPKWERGDLTTHQVEEVAVHCIEDIWADTYRINQSEVARLNTFCQRIKSCIETATGRHIEMRP